MSTYVRPLPQTPQTPSLSPSLTPSATPSPPSTPKQLDVIPANLLPPRTTSLRPTLSRLQVPPVMPSIEDDTPGTAVSALSFMPPSPATRHRQTVSKLARFLGEEIPRELLNRPGISRRSPELSGVIEDEETGELNLAPPSVVETDENDKGDDGVSFTRRSGPNVRLASDALTIGRIAGQPANGNLILEQGHHRLSSHWYREKQGKLVEQDPRDVVNSLRTLW